MNRRSERYSGGLVNFPIGNHRYRDTKEGGMTVQILVIPINNDPIPQKWAECCGSSNVYMISIDTPTTKVVGFSGLCLNSLPGR